MSEPRITTAAEAMQLSPNERSRLFEESIVDDLTDLPPEFLARVQLRGLELLKARGLHKEL